MALTITNFNENAGSRRGNATQATRSYTVAGHDSGVPMTEDQLSEYLQSEIGTDIPETVGDLGISDTSYSESDEIPGHYEVTITWDVPSEIGYRFNFQAQGGHFVQSLKTISAWGRGLVSATSDPLDLEAAGLPNFGGAINVVPQEDGPPKVEGYDVQPPPETFVLIYHAYDETITGEYQQLVRDLCGKVNNDSFMDLDAGTTMLVRANGERQHGGIWTIEFGFGYVPNLEDPLVIGNGISYSDKVQVNAKDGLDLLWVYREHEIEDTYGIVRPMPVAAYVERVWERADLNELNLPGIEVPEP
jgi:hypothetical protein